MDNRITEQGMTPKEAEAIVARAEAKVGPLPEDLRDVIATLATEGGFAALLGARQVLRDSLAAGSKPRLERTHEDIVSRSLTITDSQGLPAAAPGGEVAWQIDPLAGNDGAGR